jgi:hypothetical protein
MDTKKRIQNLYYIMHHEDYVTLSIHDKIEVKRWYLDLTI